MDDAGDLVGVDRLHDLGHLGDVATVEGDGVHGGVEAGTRGRKVEGDDLLAAVEELANDTGADEAGASGNHDCHKGVRSCDRGGLGIMIQRDSGYGKGSSAGAGMDV